MRIAIVGGGWSGLACAAALAHHRRQHSVHSAAKASMDITLLEAAPQCGGRARGLLWRGHAIDNGQHLVVGAYTEFLNLLGQAQAPTWYSEPLRWTVVQRDQCITHQWRVPDQAWPLRGLASLRPATAPRGWPWSWRWSLATTLLGLVRNRWQVPEAHAAQWLASQRTPAGLIDHFWRPLTEGALNTPWPLASAQVLSNVIRDTLGGSTNATRVLVPPRNLSLDGVDPVVAHLKAQGVTIRCGHRVTRIHCDPRPRLTLRHGEQTEPHAFDRVVLALPFHDTLRLWSDSAMPPTAAMSRLQTLRAQAITTVWLSPREHRPDPLAGLPTWFVLAPIPGVPHIGQVVVRRENVLGVVISARAPEAVDQERDMRELGHQLHATLGLDLNAMDCRWITEKSATWGCTPDVALAKSDEASGHTGLPFVYRCGDDLEPGYPATLESAVRSGRRTARQLISEMA